MIDWCIIGAMKCGSTTLARALDGHSQCSLAGGKELHYFDFYYERGESWYRSVLPPSNRTIIGEATPNYLHDVDAPKRLAEVAPRAKLLVILRDPVERAYSHYWHEVERGRETLDFENAILAEESRLAGATRQERAHVSYVSKGRYAEQLDRWMEHFDRSQLHIIFLEDLRESAAQVSRDLQQFLDVAEEPMPSLNVAANSYLHFRSLTVRNFSKRLPSPFRQVVGRLNAVKSKYPPLGRRVRESLQISFAESNKRLQSDYGLIVPW